MKRVSPQLCFLIFAMCLSFFRQCISQSSMDSFCNAIVPVGYKLYKPPENQGKPVDVFVAFQVLDVGEINQEKMDYRLHTFLVNIWKDNRLLLKKFQEGNAIIYPQCRHYIWTPDIFFEDAKQVQNYEDTTPSTLMQVLDDGAIYLSSRFSFKARCNMNLKHYPFDIQTCEFYLAFMSSSDNVAKLRWTGSPDSPYKDLFPSINMVRDVEPLQFYLKEPRVDFITEDFTTGNYTSLIAIFSLVRRLTGSIVNTYAPSTMIVTMSWVGFWLHVDAVPARVALSVTSLLTLCTQAEQYKSQMPTVNYIKAMDIWLFVCIFMVFATLLEFAFSYNLQYRKCSECSKDEVITEDDKNNSQDNESPLIKLPRVNPWLNENKKKIKFVLTTVKDPKLDGFSSAQTKNKNCEKCKSYHHIGVKIDQLSRKLFPGFFLIFVIIYWVYYLSIYNSHS